MNFAQLHKRHQLSVSGIIHVGGHWAEESQSYTRHGVTRQMWFEPIQANFDELKRRHPELVAFQCALGSKASVSPMYVETANQGESCSLLKPGTHLKLYPWITFDSMETVTVKMLDDFDTDGYSFLVIDAQGSELDVLKGATETLRHIDHVFCEVNKEFVYEDCALFEQVTEYLGGFSFRLQEVEWCTESWGNAFYSK